VNVQMIADPAGRLICSSPALPGVRPDMAPPAEHVILDALNDAGVPVVADNGRQGAGPNLRVPQRRRRLDPHTGRYRRPQPHQGSGTTRVDSISCHP
jgi:hypothetical protein